MKSLFKILYLIVSIFLLVGCNNEIEDSKETGVYLSGKSDFSKNNYQILKNFGNDRGEIVNRVYNRLDINNIEIELMNLSEEHFPSSKYSFREGNSVKNISKWLKRESETTDGLNSAIDTHTEMDWPDIMQLEKENPKYLAHIEEQEFVDKDGKIAGLSIGIILNSIYYYDVKDEQGLKHFDSVKIKQSIIKNEGKKFAEIILKRIREENELANIPIFIGLYIQADKNSILPGHYYAFSMITEGNQIKNWTDINRQLINISSKTFEEVDKELYERIFYIKHDLVNYYNINYSLTGKGLPEDSHIKELTIELAIDPLSYTNLVGLVQFLATEILNLSREIPVTLTISSLDEIRALIVCKNNEDPFIHIYQ